MQSHTYMASRTFSFRCEFGCWEGAMSRSFPCLVHQWSLPVLVSLGRFMLTSFRLVRPRTTSYWDRSALIPLVTSQTTLSIVDRPYKPTQVFLECFVLTHTLYRKLPRSSPIPKFLKVKHAELWSSYGMGYRKEDASFWYRKYQTILVSLPFNHAVPYLHGLRIPLIAMWFGSSRSCWEQLIVVPCASASTRCPRQPWVLHVH